MSTGFEGGAAWVTGASSGIGRELARELARRGADVAVSARRVARLEALADEITALGRRALVVPCDVTHEDDMRKAASRVREGFGRLDVAIANAGFGVLGRIEDLTAEDWRRQLETNVIGVAITARAALPALHETRGRLALVGSVAAMLTTPGNGAYSASKYAVRAIGQTLSQELHGSGVSCTTLHPGFVASEIAQVDNRGVFHPERSDRRPARLMWPTDRAARVMVEAIRRRRREVVFTAHGRFAAFIGRHAPGLVHLATTRFAGSARS